MNICLEKDRRHGRDAVAASYSVFRLATCVELLLTEVIVTRAGEYRCLLCLCFFKVSNKFSHSPPAQAEDRSSLAAGEYWY